MQVIIAEKPSVAREIAAIVGARNRKEGYIEGNGYAVTWAFGHLVGLAMPQQYGIEGFRAENRRTKQEQNRACSGYALQGGGRAKLNLPILPPKFTLLPRQIKEGKEYKSDPGVLKQLSVIKELFDIADRIVVATDAGREGELIFRYIYTFLECRKPFVRLWISSLTDKAIREGLQHLRPGAEYDNLYLSAKARSEADWVVGINASQALAVAAGRGVWSLGRVQTPTRPSSAPAIWKTRLSRPRPTFNSNSTRQRMRLFSPHCLSSGSTTSMRRKQPMPPSWMPTWCASSKSSARR